MAWSAIARSNDQPSPSWSTSGWGFLAIACRGYPGSTGTPNEDGLLADGDAAVAFVGKESPGAPILFHGHSLGTGVVVAMAATYPSKGLYLEAPFDTMTAVATGHYPFVPGFILRDTFRSIDRMPRVTSPILIIHGLADVTIPPERGRALAASAARGVNFIHNDVFGIRDVEAEAMFVPLQRNKSGYHDDRHERPHHPAGSEFSAGLGKPHSTQDRQESAGS